MHWPVKAILRLLLWLAVCTAAAELLLWLYARLRPGSPEHGLGPDIAGLATVAITRGIGLGLAVRLAFPPRIIGIEPGVVPPDWRVAFAIDKGLIAAAILVALVLTLAVPLQERWFLRKASARWNAAQQTHRAELEPALQAWRRAPALPATGAALVELLDATTIETEFWEAATAGWSEKEMRELLDFYLAHPHNVIGLTDFALRVAHDPAYSIELRTECFLTCLSFSSNQGYPLERAWGQATTIPLAEQIVPQAVIRRSETAIPSAPDDWWLLRPDALTPLEAADPPWTELAPTLEAALDRAGPGAPAEVIERGRALVERWERALPPDAEAP